MGSNRFARPLPEATVVFAWDPADAEELARLSATAEQADAVARSTFARDEDRDAAVGAREALSAFLASTATISFRLRACGVPRRKALEAEHPPTKEQQKRADELHERAGQPKRLLAYDEDSFPAALVAECCTRIEVTGDDGWIVEGAEEITPELITELVFGSAAWSEADQNLLLARCGLLMEQPTIVPPDLVAYLGNG